MPDEHPKAAGTGPASAFPAADHPRNDEPMTSDQADELAALSKKHGEAFDQSLSRDAAQSRINELREKGGL